MDRALLDEIMEGLSEFLPDYELRLLEHEEAVQAAFQRAPITQCQGEWEAHDVAAHYAGPAWGKRRDFRERVYRPARAYEYASRR